MQTVGKKVEKRDHLEETESTVFQMAERVMEDIAEREQKQAPRDSDLTVVVAMLGLWGHEGSWKQRSCRVLRVASIHEVV